MFEFPASTRRLVVASVAGSTYQGRTAANPLHWQL